MGTEVGLAGMVEDTGAAMAAHRLQRGAVTLLVAIVDDQGPAAVLLHACADCRREGASGLADFRLRAFGGVGQEGRERRDTPGQREGERLAALGQSHPPFAPPALRLLYLPH